MADEVVTIKKRDIEMIKETLDLYHTMALKMVSSEVVGDLDEVQRKRINDIFWRYNPGNYGSMERFLNKKLNNEVREPKKIGVSD